jgi:hypothetical protein
MNANDDIRAKRLDEYIDALNAGKPAPPETDDADLAELFATARDFHRLRAAEPAGDDVPSRLAAALERELRADQTRDTRRIENDDMNLFRDVSSNGAIRPPEGNAAPYAVPRRPERGRQLLQFFAAVAAFVVVGVVLTQIFGGQHGGEPDGSFGSDRTGAPTEQVAAPADVATQTPEPTPSSPVSTLEPTQAVPDPTEGVNESVEPSVTPPPATPLAALLRLSLDYATCEDTVVAYGSGFEPGSAITIHGGQLIGDNFAPVVDEHPVGDDGSFEVELDLSRLISECGGGSSEPEGSRYRLAASTGSSLSKDGVDIDGPSAMTVLTFSREVPESVKHRMQYQYCGVEVMLSGTMLREAGEPDRLARECFTQAVRIGGYAAEFVSHRLTTEGDLVTTIYRTSGDGSVEEIVDSTGARFGGGGWTTTACMGASLAGEDFGYLIQLTGCGEPVTIE